MVGSIGVVVVVLVVVFSQRCLQPKTDGGEGLVDFPMTDESSPPPKRRRGSSCL